METVKRYAISGTNNTVIEEIMFIGSPSHPQSGDDGRVVVGVSNALYDGPNIDPYTQPLKAGITLLGTDGFDGAEEYKAINDAVAAKMRLGDQAKAAAAAELVDQLQADRAILAAWLISQGAPANETNRAFGVIRRDGGIGNGTGNLASDRDSGDMATDKRHHEQH